MNLPDTETSSEIDKLLDIMARLRDPDNGCPWDVQQDFTSIAPYTIEEAYEVADAIERGNMGDLKDELGDLLFQVVFHARMAEEEGAFSFSEVVDSVCDKMTRRHPHVFDGSVVRDADAQSKAWEDTKAGERAEKAGDSEAAASLMADIPRGMAELQRAVKLQKRAARAGFDWASPGPVLDKLREETLELREAMESGDVDHIEDELGDLLFVVTNLARQLDVDPARALRRGNAKFERRFRRMEQVVRDDPGMKSLDTMSLNEMESMWQKVKQDETARPQSESSG
jgi:MazG family protein